MLDQHLPLKPGLVGDWRRKLEMPDNHGELELDQYSILFHCIPSVVWGCLSGAVHPQILSPSFLCTQKYVERRTYYSEPKMNLLNWSYPSPFMAPPFCLLLPMLTSLTEVWIIARTAHFFPFYNSTRVGVSPIASLISKCHSATPARIRMPSLV